MLIVLVGAAKAIVSRYQKMIIDEHEDYCLWRKRGCDGASIPIIFVFGC